MISIKINVFDTCCPLICYINTKVAHDILIRDRCICPKPILTLLYHNCTTCSTNSTHFPFSQTFFENYVTNGVIPYYFQAVTFLEVSNTKFCTHLCTIIRTRYQAHLSHCPTSNTCHVYITKFCIQ
jgi:hypothetical protein